MGRKLLNKTILVLFIMFSLSAESSVNFFHYGTEQGLTEQGINIIAQDSIGFIWLASDYNLTRFDGHQFKNYNNNAQSNYPWNRINTLFSDNEGTLWIGSDTGFSYYNFFSDSFSNPPVENGLTNITAFAADHDHNLWISGKQGVVKFNKKHEKLTWIIGKGPEAIIDIDSFGINVFKHLTVEESGSLWLVTSTNLLFRFNPSNNVLKKFNGLNNFVPDQFEITGIKSFRNFLFISTASNGFYRIDLSSEEVKNQILDYNSNWIHHFQQENDSIIWVATNSGLYRLNHEIGSYTQFTNIEADPLSMKKTTTIYVYIDTDKNIWLTSGIGGIDYGINNSFFDHLMFSEEFPYNLTNKEVSGIDFDREGNMWTGYQAGLLEKHNSFPPYTKEKYFLYKKGNSQTFGNVFKIMEDSHEQIWAGGWETGLQRLNRKNRKFEHIKCTPEKINKLLEVADIRDIKEGPAKNLWISAHGIGLIKLNPVTLKARLFSMDESNFDKNLSNNFLYTLDFQGENLWIATSYGVNRLDTKEMNFTHYFQNPDDSVSLSDDMINTLHCDKSGLVWAGTANGLNLFLPGENSFVPVKLNYDFRFNNITAIESVYPEEIWVSTKSGIMRLKYDNDSVFANRKFDIDYFFRSNGLISSIYFDRVSTTNSTNNIYFGGNNGVDFFIPPVKSTDFAADKSAVVTEVSVYGKKINRKNEHNFSGSSVLVFDHTQKMISFRFTSVEFENAEQQKFRYKVEGFDKEWVYPRDEHVATYTNLNPGKYTFRVEATNKNDEWVKNENNIINFKITPPFWKTIPFAVLSLLIVSALFFTIQRIRFRVILKRQQELEKQVKERTRELRLANAELKDANQTKNKFFSIISHDLRSPFSGLLGILELLKDPEFLPKEKQTELMNTAHETAENTFKLLENLLIWSSSQTEKLNFQPKIFNITSKINNNIALSQQQANLKRIAVNNNLKPELHVFGDPNMIDTVIRNILNNAIKFTYEEGKIDISATEDKQKITISISDTGIGMKQEQIEKLFDIENKSKSGTNGEGGTGLGLFISKEFISINNGEIWATENHPHGTTFHFTIPKGNQQD